MRLITILLAAALAGRLCAAEQPLGLVDGVDNGMIDISFSAGARVAPGAVVAIYGPGSVIKHPLTKQVIVEDRKLLAKAQLTSVAGGKVRARIGWLQAGSDVQAGMDVVPLPSEASPNAAPALKGMPETVVSPLQGAVRVKAPIEDPDGDAVSYAWSLAGPVGQVGVLAARTTSQPEVTWLSPGIAATAEIRVLARDAYGHEFSATIPASSAGAADDDWRKRECRTLLSAGGETQKIERLERDTGGAWWGVGDGSIRRVSPGWNKEAGLKIPEKDRPEKPIAAVPFRKELYVLDAGSLNVRVYGPDGTLNRRIGSCKAPTDLVIDDDGVLFIADRELGGVLIYEKDGSFRSRLGQGGKGKDAFATLARLARSLDGGLFALDAEQRAIQRFDRFQRRLETWQIQADGKAEAIDIAWHPRGLLALCRNGRILIYNELGLANESFPSLGEAKLVEDAGSPESLFVDINGDVFVTYPDGGFIARYDAQGKCTGVRGNALWQFKEIAADGLGRVFGLDAEGQLKQFDAEGWLVARRSGMTGRRGQISEAADMAVSPDGQALVILDSDKKNVFRFSTADLGEKPLVFAQPGKNNGQVTEPIAVAMDESSRTYVLDAGLCRVAVFDAQGKFQFNFGGRGKGSDELTRPMLLAVSPAGDAAYIYDYDKFEVKKFALDQKAQKGDHVTNVGGKGDGPAQIRKLIGMGCDRVGMLYILDSGREDLQLLDFRGNNAVALQKRKSADFDLRRVETFSMNPDGLALIGGGGELVGIRW